MTHCFEHSKEERVSIQEEQVVRDQEGHDLGKSHCVCQWRDHWCLWRMKFQLSLEPMIRKLRTIRDWKDGNVLDLKGEFGREGRLTQWRDKMLFTKTCQKFGHKEIFHSLVIGQQWRAHTGWKVCGRGQGLQRGKLVGGEFFLLDWVRIPGFTVQLYRGQSCALGVGKNLRWRNWLLHGRQDASFHSSRVLLNAF